MKKLRKRIKPGIAILLITLMTFISVLPAFAAAVQVSVDETVYTNLDYYGNIKDLSIVKGVNLNGYTQFQDFGEYTNVINMTSDNVGKVEDNSVSFSNLDNSKKFYYEVTPKENTIKLPWTFDLSYKLNGVPTNAKDLAGALGLVEINISAKPQDTGVEYLNNNMILILGSIVDMTKNLSVEAPGGQVQSLGNNSLVMFTALPGEEKDFTIRIGSNSFESAGIIMSMVPATMDSLDKIKEINDEKDDIKDSVDAIHNSSSALFDLMNSMGKGLNSLNSGLSELQNARAKIHSYGDNLTLQTDKGIEELNTLANSTSETVPYLIKSKDALNDFNKNLNKIDEEVTLLRPSLLELTDSMGDVENSIGSIGYVLNNAKTDETLKLITELKAKIDTAKSKLEALKKGIGENIGLATGSNADINSINNSLNQVQESLSNSDLLVSDRGVSPEGLYYTSLENMVSSTNTMYGSIDKMIKDTEAYLDALTKKIEEGSIKTVKDLNTVILSGKDLTNTTSDMIDDIQVTTINLADIMEDMKGITDTANKYHGDVLSAADSINNLTTSVENNITVAADTLNTLNNMFKNSRGDLNEGTRKSISASMELIDKTTSGLDITNTLKESGDVINNIWNKRVNELESESNILNIDTGAAKPSFTSEKNPEPESIQIVVRTQEINIEDEGYIEDLDADEDNMTPIKRIGNVFKKIFDFFKSFVSGE